MNNPNPNFNPDPNVLDEGLPLMLWQVPADTMLWRGGDYTDLLTTALTAPQFHFIVFVFVSIGLVMWGVPPWRCAAQQNVPDFMTKTMINNISDYHVKYSLIIHNRLEDTFVEHSTAFIEWKSREDNILKANLHIYPQRDLFNQGAVENGLLTYLPGGLSPKTDYLPMDVWKNWEVAPLLKLYSREGSTLQFYIEHLFKEGIPHSYVKDVCFFPGIIDIRGFVFHIQDKMLNLTPASPLNINDIPDPIEKFIDILQNDWWGILV